MTNKANNFMSRTPFHGHEQSSTTEDVGFDQITCLITPFFLKKKNE